MDTFIFKIVLASNISLKLGSRTKCFPQSSNLRQSPRLISGVHPSGHPVGHWRSHGKSLAISSKGWCFFENHQLVSFKRYTPALPAFLSTRQDPPGSNPRHTRRVSVTAMIFEDVIESGKTVLSWKVKSKWRRVASHTADLTMGA